MSLTGWIILIVVFVVIFGILGIKAEGDKADQRIRAADKAMEEKRKEEEEKLRAKVEAEELEVNELNQNGLKELKECDLILGKDEICYMSEKMMVVRSAQDNPYPKRVVTQFQPIPDQNTYCYGTFYVTNKRILMLSDRLRFESPLEDG
jgi:Sec-independent protein translocase protein TatA